MNECGYCSRTNIQVKPHSWPCRSFSTQRVKNMSLWSKWQTEQKPPTVHNFNFKHASSDNQWTCCLQHTLTGTYTLTGKHVCVNFTQTGWVTRAHKPVCYLFTRSLPCTHAPLWSTSLSQQPLLPPEHAQWRTRKLYHLLGYQFQTVALPAQTGHLETHTHTHTKQVNCSKSTVAENNKLICRQVWNNIRRKKRRRMMNADVSLQRVSMCCCYQQQTSTNWPDKTQAGCVGWLQTCWFRTNGIQVTFQLN